MAKKIVNADIYNITKLIDDLKAEFIPEENEETLAAGSFGYIGAIEAKRLQTQVRMTGELCNESFTSRARLERNVITHAITNNIENINAVPAKMDVIIGIRQVDIIDLMSNDTFILDRECPIYIGDYEFHFEYDIIIRRIPLSGNEKSYTAQYDITRENPSSDIVNPYITAPAVTVVGNETYIFINAIISQVEHMTTFKKVTTSNVIDNKTINFEFQNQLSYFEVHVKESDDDKYLTPVFEGAGVPEGTTYYCWYQYINTDMIRVRFDRNSYMPGLNAEIEVNVKTTTGNDGNFPHPDDFYATFESSNYGYKNITLLFMPTSDSENGKNRKSKKELQALLPKEALARGALTTIKDLNNYFGMIDSEEGRIVVQKKIDNQKERIYYAYSLLKDINGNIVPSNTIDLMIPMDSLLKTSVSDSASPRYILRSGTCIGLMNDNTTGKIVTTPIKNLGLSWTSVDVKKGETLTIKFQIRIDSDEYPSMNCRALVKNKSSVYIESPLYENSIYAPENLNIPEEAKSEMIVSAGQLLKMKIVYKAVSDGDITITEHIPKAFTYIEDKATYIASGDRVPVKIDPVIDTSGVLDFTISNVTKDTTYTLEYEVFVGTELEMQMAESHTIKNGSSTYNSPEMIFYAVILELKENPKQLLQGNILEYTVKTIANEDWHLPKIDVELSRGVSYITKSSKSTITDVDGNDTEIIYEPMLSDLILDAGFLYTNPYSIVINHYHLYASFYMMCVKISPYVHFDYINQRSAVQFIATNINWDRPFFGYNKNKYTMSMEITQSISQDMGLFIPADDDNPDYICNMKMIALFYRDGAPYRYKNLELAYADMNTYSYGFSAEFLAHDLFDHENNIKVGNMGLLNQLEEDYGFFNPNTSVKIYTLCKSPDVDGKYTRWDIDLYVPGLDGWTVTNVYDVVNGVNFFYNYAEIMGSRVEPYGVEVYDEESQTNILVPDGYYIKGVPVFGYDYCRDETLINNAVNALNDKKLYIDDAVEKLENSFGIDFKAFNTYGPSKIFYVIKDANNNMLLDDEKVFIDRVNITMYFRLKLRVSNDAYTKNLIIKDIKDYMEDLNELGEVHFPNLITQITNDYSESIIYFEFLGINEYGPGVQHLYKLLDNQIPIHICPEFINVNNVRGADSTLTPDINIYITED